MITVATIRRVAWWRIALVSVLMSVVLGVAQYFYQMENMDDRIVARAMEESYPALVVLRLLVAGHAQDSPELSEEIETLQRRFSIIELYDINHKKWFDKVTKENEWVEDALETYPDHGFGQGDEPFYRRLLINKIWFWQVVAPINNEQGQIEGYFEGVYHLSIGENDALYLSTLVSVLMVIVATLMTGLVMYPLLLRLTRNLEEQSQAVLLGNVELMEVMGEAIARRDSDTNIHNYRVTLYTILLAQAMRYPNDQMSALVAGAFLHDVGKIGIPDAILLKPGKLTDDEFVIMKTHVSIGAQILARASWLASARDIPQYHHEKYDGSGYMSGLVGEAIPLSARIFAVVDVFDALTADRPYKKAMPLEQALSILQQGAGSHFDPKIVTIFSQYAAIWYQQIYQQSEEDVEKALRQQVTQIFSA